MSGTRLYSRGIAKTEGLLLEADNVANVLVARTNPAPGPAWYVSLARSRLNRLGAPPRPFAVAGASVYARVGSGGQFPSPILTLKQTFRHFALRTEAHDFAFSQFLITEAQPCLCDKEKKAREATDVILLVSFSRVFGFSGDPRSALARAKKKGNS